MVLGEVNRTAFDVGPGVQKHELVLRSGHHHGNPGTIHPLQRTHPNGGRGHHPPRVAWRNKGFRLAFFDEIDRPQNGAVLFLAQPHHRLVFHAEDLAGMHNFDPRVPAADVTQPGLNGLALAHKVNSVDVTQRREGLGDATHHHPRAMVAAHDIHHDSHKEKERRRGENLPRSGKN